MSDTAKPRAVPGSKVLLPGEFKGIIPEPLGDLKK